MLDIDTVKFPRAKPIVPNTITQFDRVYYLSLDKRSDRRDLFWDNLANCQWPFKELPRRVRATCPESVPPGYGFSTGAYGCTLSHTRIWKTMLDYNETALILEDDALFKNDFGPQVLQFLTTVPNDWDCLMIGGDHLGKMPRKLTDTIYRCTYTYSTHCYTMRGAMLRECYDTAVKSLYTLDRFIGGLMWKYKVYAPNPFIVGQRESYSDIDYRVRPTDFGDDFTKRD